MNLWITLAVRCWKGTLKIRWINSLISTVLVLTTIAFDRREIFVGKNQKFANLGSVGLDVHTKWTWIAARFRRSILPFYFIFFEKSRSNSAEMFRCKRRMRWFLMTCRYAHYESRSNVAIAIALVTNLERSSMTISHAWTTILFLGDSSHTANSELHCNCCKVFRLAD